MRFGTQYSALSSHFSDKTGVIIRGLKVQAFILQFLLPSWGTGLDFRSSLMFCGVTPTNISRGGFDIYQQIRLSSRQVLESRIFFH